MTKKITKGKKQIENHQANRSKARAKRVRLKARLQQSPKMISLMNIRIVTLAGKMQR